MKKILIISMFVLLAAVNVAVITNISDGAKLTLNSLLKVAVANGESSNSKPCTSSEFLVEDIMEPCSNGSGYYTYREVNVNCNYNGSGPCADGISISWEDCDGDRGGCSPSQVSCS
jgi:hypothetical protein